MTGDETRRRLGRGLAALIGDIDAAAAELSAAPVAADRHLPIDRIAPNPRNPRRHFPDAELDELSESLRRYGLVQPVVVRPLGGAGEYEIIAGERRWRAAQRAGMTEIPVVVRSVDDRTALELAIIENVQRADLNALEEAQGYQQLMDEHGYTQADLGQVVNKSRSHVANTLRLLRLPHAVHDMLQDGQLSAGHARTLVTAANPTALAQKIVRDGLSVRQAEALAQAPADPGPTGRAAHAAKDPDTLALEKTLSDITGLNITIQHRGRGGDVRIAYKSLDQLDELCRLLKG